MAEDRSRKVGCVASPGLRLTKEGRLVLSRVEAISGLREDVFTISGRLQVVTESP